MKVAFLVLVLVVAATATDVADILNVSDAQKANLKRIEKECIEETKVDADLVHKFDEGQFADTPELRCYYSCYNIKYGSMDKNGVYDMEKMKPILPESHIKIVEKCITIKGEDVCDTAYQAYKCYIKHLLDQA